MRKIGSRIRIKSAGEVRASLDTFGGRVAVRLGASRPAPAGETGPGFDYEALFPDIDGRLASVEGNLISAEDAHVRQLIHLSDMRRESEESAAALYQRHVAVRRVLAGLFGPDRGFEIAAFEGETPRELKALRHQTQQSVQFLREPAIQLPPMKTAGVVVDFEGMAVGLEQGLEETGLVDGRLDRARKAVDETGIVRRQAIAEFDALFPWAAQALEGIFRMAGERELADRIRTSRRRVTRRQAEEVEESDEPSSGGSEAENAAPST